MTNLLKFHFSKEEANCLRNDPSVNRTDEQILRVLPGKLLSLDEQCQRMGYLKAYGVSFTIHKFKSRISI